MSRIEQRLAQELGVREPQITAAIALLDGGATVPFIARYRKEATGELDDAQLRLLEERLQYLRELDQRRQTILTTIEAQGQLNDALRLAIEIADSKTRLEDLYLPYKPKRRTKAQIAREAGLEPLAASLLEQPEHTPETLAVQFLNPEQAITDADTALAGARQILMERFAEDAELVGELRDYVWDHAWLCAQVVEGQTQVGAKFADYFDYREALPKIPSHRVLALLRGRNEGILNLTLDFPDLDSERPHPCEARIARHVQIHDQGRPADAWLQETARWTWRVKLAGRIELDIHNTLRQQAEDEAIQVFARNLKDLLLAAPAGPRPTMGLDPGLRTGVKVAVVDTTGKLVATETIYPHPPQKQWEAALATLAHLAQQHRVELISIGNGTASRETDKLVQELLKRHPALKLQKLLISEAGASVYSASALASEELPDIDVSLRGAASIARRLQDPLAELVKIDPKAIGVGQYQHDLNQGRLSRTLDAVVEDCVNAVGVDVNTASIALLSRVAGLNAGLARQIVGYRDQYSAFPDRKSLLKVPRLGHKTFEQAAGFLRIMNGTNPLDRSAVHPEAYPLAQRIIAACGQPVHQVLGQRDLLRGLNPTRFTDEHFGLPTVRDILGELEKPGRDPRPEFKTAVFRDDIATLADLRPGMVLEGVVSNVANFGAFVDIGVHQDGLIHVSALANRFVRDPRDIVKAGDVVTVKVMTVDPERRRIGLSLRLDDEPGQAPSAPAATRPKPSKSNNKPRSAPSKPPPNMGALAAAFEQARKRR